MENRIASYPQPAFVRQIDFPGGSRDLCVIPNDKYRKLIHTGSYYDKQLRKKVERPPLTLRQARVAFLVEEYGVEPIDAIMILQGEKPMWDLVSVRQKWQSMTRQEKITSISQRFGIDLETASNSIDRHGSLSLNTEHMIARYE